WSSDVCSSDLVIIKRLSVVSTNKFNARRIPMIRTLSLVATMAVSLALSSMASAETWENGVHYRTLNNPVNTYSEDGVEVAEVFWYGCPHCYNFKPLAEAWEESAPDYVNYVR